MSLKIGCDIGGVIRDLVSENPITDSIKSINKLLVTHKVVFISKCKEKYKDKSFKWLKENNLSSIPVYFCLEYADKVNIASDEKINVMIDDRLQVLKNFLILL